MSFSFPWESLAGGVLLGVSATMLLLVNGKIAGISGILKGLLTPKHKDFSWRLMFIVGMVAGGFLGALAYAEHAPDEFNYSTLMLVAAGLLVGLGTRLGNGCTSGHGICGIGRLSRRSIVATVTFMLVAGVTVFIRLHVV